MKCISAPSAVVKRLRSLRIPMTGRPPSPSFEMCECGFEFGFDDSPLASSEAVEGIEANWIRWRRPLIETATRSPSEFAALEQRLLRIGRRLAFDLLDVPTEKTGEQVTAPNGP